MLTVLSLTSCSQLASVGDQCRGLNLCLWEKGRAIKCLLSKVPTRTDNGEPLVTAGPTSQHKLEKNKNVSWVGKTAQAAGSHATKRL